MNLKKLKNNYFEGINDISIIHENKKLSIMYRENLDLYWMVSDENILNNSEISQINFEITKENYQIYQQFELLFSNLENLNIFDEKNDETAIKHYKDCTRYNDLYNNGKITWYSDETNEKVANYLEISKCKDKFLLSFHIQPYIDGYDYDTHHHNSIAIRFRNSGSRYSPFNILFMKMYDALQLTDDIYDEGHQIHIEEYNYEKEKKLIKKI